MNPIRKLYCRTFQVTMRAALPLLPYREPTPLHSIREIPPLLKKNGINSVLLVTDKGVRSLGLTAPLEGDLKASGILCAVYDATRANPTTANVEEALALYHSRRCAALIAVGGGSSMDCAKATGARLARPGKSLNQMEGILKVGRKLPLLIAVPTTAGTGSETTLAAVIVDPATHHKYAINDFPLIPDYAVLDPDMTLTLPPHLTATTGMDALTHAVEAYIGRSTTKETRQAAVQAVQLILEYLPAAYADGKNRQAREQMLQAAYLAGTAFTQSYVGYVHAVAHSLGGKYGMAHGLANAVLLPIVLEEYGSAAWPRLAKLARAVGLTHLEDDQQAAQLFIEKIRAMNAAMEIPEALPGIQEEDIPTLTAFADREANPLYPVPQLWNREKLAHIYHLVREEEHHDRS